MDTNSIMMMLQDKLPKNPASVMALREKLDKTSEVKKDELMKNLPFLNLKSPALVFWVGSFLFGAFGVGRFMIGDKTIGAIRLGLAILFFVLYGLAFGIQSTIVLGLAAFVRIAVLIWWVVDLFLTGKKLRKQNLDKIMQAL